MRRVITPYVAICAVFITISVHSLCTLAEFAPGVVDHAATPEEREQREQYPLRDHMQTESWPMAIR